MIRLIIDYCSCLVDIPSDSLVVVQWQFSPCTALFIVIFIVVLHSWC